MQRNIIFEYTFRSCSENAKKIKSNGKIYDNNKGLNLRSIESLRTKIGH